MAALPLTSAADAERRLEAGVSYSRMLVSDPQAHVRLVEWLSEARAAFATLWESTVDADPETAKAARQRLQQLLDAMSTAGEAMVLEAQANEFERGGAECEHDAPLSDDKKCSQCGVQFVVCPGCSESAGSGLPVHHTAPICEAAERGGAS